MYTNFLQKQSLADYIQLKKPKTINARTLRYKNEQDKIIDNYLKVLRDNIFRAKKLNLKARIEIPIQQSLWWLWNNAWSLGERHASAEVNTNFSVNDTINFAKKENEKAKLVREIGTLRDEQEYIDSNYKNKEGNWRLNAALKNTGKKGNYSEEDREKARQVLEEQQSKRQQEIEIRQQRLSEIYRNEAEQKQNINQKVKNTSAPKSKLNVNQENLNEEQKRYIKNEESYKGKLTDVEVRDVARKQKQYNKLSNQPIEERRTPKNALTVIRDINRRRLKETNIDPEISPLEQSQFGKVYLDKRIALLSNKISPAFDDEIELIGDLPAKYRPGLSLIIPEYFTSTRVTKDAELYKSISLMLIGNSPVIKKAKNQKNIVSKLINSQPKNRQEYIAQQQTSIEENPKLTRQQKNQLISNLYKEKGRYDPDVNVDENTAKTLGIKKGTYKRSQLKNIESSLAGNIKSLNNNNDAIRRVALTEMGHAYNLGRLDYYDKQGIELVKLNNSIEHLNAAWKPEYEGTYQSRAEAIGEPFNIQGIVCPVCQERAERENGYGEGVYELDKVLSDPQLQLVFHPFCACYYEPVLDDDDDDRKKRRPKKKKRSIKVKAEAFFDNNIARWAAGGAVAILGTALMYALYRQTKAKVPSPTPSSGALVNVTRQTLRSTTPLSTNKTIGNQLLENIQQIVVDNADTIANQEILELPLKELKQPERVEVQLSQYREAEATINDSPSLYKKASIRENIDTNVMAATTLVGQSNAANPNVAPGLQDQIKAINDRLEYYASYARSNLSRAERQSVVRQYREDLKLLNNTVNNIETSNITLYAQVQSLYKAREETLDVLNRSQIAVPEGVSKTAFIENTPSMREINNNILNIENTLRANSNLFDNGFVDDLNNIKQGLVNNPDLQNDYLQDISGILSRSANKIPNKGTLAELQELELLERVVNNTQNMEDIYEQLSVRVYKLAQKIDDQFKKISNNIIDIDVDYLSSLTERMESINIDRAIQIKNYRDRLKYLQNRLFIVTNNLMNKKPQ